MSGSLNRLSVKIIVPIVAIMLLTGVPLYLLIHSTVTDFARENIKKDLEVLSRHVFDVVDRGFMDLVREGLTDDRTASRIKQVDCMDSIELFTRDQNFLVVITNGKGKIIFNSRPDLHIEELSEDSGIPGIRKHSFNGTSYFSRTTYFSPWDWNITVYKDTEKYADLSKKISMFSLLMGSIWIIGTVLLILFILKTVQSPIRSIINSVSKGEYPDYRGTEEFEFLSEAIAEMMHSLQDARLRAENNERQLQLINEEIQALLNNSPVGIIYVGETGSIEEINHEAEKLTGYSRKELVGHPISKILDDSDNRENFAKKARPILEERHSASFDFNIKHKFGHIVPCHLHGRALTDRHGPKGIIWILEDITERLKTEQELLKIKKLEAVGVLAGGLAHDFNNLLTAVVGNLALASGKLGVDHPVRKYIHKSEQAALRATDLTQKLLTFSKGDAPIKKTSSLPELIRESADFILHGSGIQCRYYFPDNLYQADIDRGQICQVIQNLVLNARQAMNDNGMLTINCTNIRRSELPPKALELTSENYIRITIQDTGPGIPENIADRIFDPYFSTKELDSNKGSGLGLAIVHSIMEKHSGLVTIDSTPGEGALFSLYLPASNEEEKEGRKEPKIEATQEKGTERKMVLIMDDDEMIRDTASEMLRYLGYESVHAVNGTEAISIYREEMQNGRGIDIVIMDLTIPGGQGGRDCIQELLKLDPDAQVIVSSGYAHDPVMANYSSYGFAAALPKPFTIQAMSVLLKGLVKSSR